MIRAPKRLGQYVQTVGHFLGYDLVHFLHPLVATRGTFKEYQTFFSYGTRLVLWQIFLNDAKVPKLRGLFLINDARCFACSNAFFYQGATFDKSASETLPPTFHSNLNIEYNLLVLSQILGFPIAYSPSSVILCLVNIFLSSLL